ncbi:hypothetical protein PACTADRAFT_48207 [Pachysolen tannophilus NRRL Y-2460]|uniref:Peptidase M20 dimerisation domain-containing protein n=1 Tax=Pachysolen tannophilus NRRL Y-2460 TaxID=669874 RepID=A0A1E4U373_PACTA|nr:hypothetical protein PACTADRAFT_48207 [Pachysolen tannophilus NRRL Y-2460]
MGSIYLSDNCENKEVDEKSLSIEFEDGTNNFKDKKNSRFKKLLLAIATIALIQVSICIYKSAEINKLLEFNDDFDSFKCPIYEKKKPLNWELNQSKIDYILHDESFKQGSIKKLSGAIQAPTEVYDDPPEVSLNPEYWAKFKKFHDFLEETFPLVYQNLKIEKVNTYGLVYTWEGSDSSLKPILLTAHQDTVPVQTETIDQWDHEPFSGFFDGKSIFGRGAIDCKHLVIALLETVELLIQEDFKPKREIVIAFGFDEEVSGNHGAAKIGEFLLEKYGENSFYALIDEGDEGLTEIGGTYFAAVPTGEKGYFDAYLALTTPGGHSSIPPDHTSIGIISELVREIENDPYNNSLVDYNPKYGYLKCVAEHSQDLDPNFKKAILNSSNDKNSQIELLKQIDADPSLRYLFRTSQAVDIVKGGAKSNALPEHVEIVVNHRVEIGKKVSDIAEHFLQRIIKISKHYELGVIYEGKEILKPTTNGYFNFTIPRSLDPAKISSLESNAWYYFAGSLRHYYEDIAFKASGISDKEVIVTPSLGTGNTDTQHYWNLTDNIYRYIPAFTSTPFEAGLTGGLHSVNERIDFEGHLSTIVFYYEYLQLVGEIEN